MSGKLWGIVIPAAVALLALVIFLPTEFGQQKNVQPLAYNHKVHVETAGLNCTDCHIHVETLASASIPNLEICQNCHSEIPLTESPEEEKLLKFVSEGKEIPWVQITTVPDHVYFSHRRHVTGGELQCVECHGNVAEFTQPVSHVAVPMTMENCMNCHRQKNVRNDCLSCHR